MTTVLPLFKFEQKSASWMMLVAASFKANDDSVLRSPCAQNIATAIKGVPSKAFRQHPVCYCSSNAQAVVVNKTVAINKKTKNR